MEPTSSNRKDLSYMQEIKEGLGVIKAGVKLLVSGVKHGLSEKLSPIEEKCTEAMQTVKSTASSAAREGSRVSYRASKALGELKNVASNVGNAGSEALGTKSPLRKEYEQISREFNNLKALHEHLTNIIAEKREIVTKLKIPDKGEFKDNEFNKLIDNMDPKDKEAYYAFLQLQTPSHELVQAFKSANDSYENLQKLMEGKKNIKEKLTENKEQKEQSVKEGIKELRKQLQGLEKAIENITGMRVQHPAPEPEKKGLISQAKDAAVRLSKTIKEVPTKAEDFIAEQKEKKRLSDFMNQCDAEIRKSDRNLQQHKVVKDMREKVDQVYRQLLTKSQQSDPEFSRLLHEFNKHPSKNSFNELSSFMNKRTKNQFSIGLAVLFGSNDKLEQAAQEFNKVTRPDPETDKWKDKKVQAKQAFENLQKLHAQYRQGEARYQEYQAKSNRSSEEFYKINDDLKNKGKELREAQAEFNKLTSNTSSDDKRSTSEPSRPSESNEPFFDETT